MKPNLKLSMACAGALALSSVRVQAQPAPLPIAQHTETVADVPPVPDQTLLSLAAGATLNSGNTKAYAGNVGGRLQLIRQPSQLTVEALGTLGYTKNPTTGDVEQTSANVLGRGRYDLFLSRNDALFIAIQPRRDTFAGLDLRLQNQIGYLRNLYYPSDAHRFWTELGYDLTYDNFSVITTQTSTTVPGPVDNQTITTTTTNTIRPGTDIVHSGRAFFGYTNLLFAAANLNLGVETLFDVEDKKNVRVNGLAEITSSVSSSFKLGVQSRVLFDNVPVPDKKKYDTIIAVQLVYTFDSLAGQVTTPSCPDCDCSAQVAEAKAACSSTGDVSEASPITEPVIAPPEAALPPAAQPSAPAEPAVVEGGPVGTP